MNEEKEMDNLFIDKIKLSFIVLKKETDLIEVYSELLKLLNQGSITVEEVENWSQYHSSWSIMNEIYTFLRYNKIKEISKRKDEGIKEKAKILKETMEKYEDTMRDITFDDLQKIIPIIHEFISLSGYHQDQYKEKGGSLEDEEF